MSVQGRDFQISGECLVKVKGRSDSAISSLSELGLPQDDIHVSPVMHHQPLNVDAAGDAPPDFQFMLAWCHVRMNLVHVSYDCLMECVRLSMAGGNGPGAGGEGSLTHAGTRLGGGFARFAVGNAPVGGGPAPGNNLMGLNLVRPVQASLMLPWRFPYAFLAEQPIDISIGTKRSMFSLNWIAFAYVPDPWNGGLGMQGQNVWDHTLDT